MWTGYGKSLYLPLKICCELKTKKTKVKRENEKDALER